MGRKKKVETETVEKQEKKTKVCFDDSCCDLDLDCIDCSYYNEVHAATQPQETTHKVLTARIAIPKDGTAYAILNEFARQLKILADFIVEDKGEEEVQIPNNGACNKGDTFASFAISEE